EAQRTGSRLVVAAGGDGTVHAVVNGLTGGDAMLGLLPLGTANDLARELALPRDARRAATRLLEGRPRKVDVATVAGRRFLTVAGLGLVSSSALAVSRAKGASWLSRRAAELLGGGSYRVAAALEILTRRRITNRLRITWTDPATGLEETRELDAHALFITNHRTCGGGLRVPSGGRADDGVLELCVVPATTRARLVANLQRLSSGRTIPPEILTVIPATRALIELAEPDHMIADGELVSRGTRFEVGVERESLDVVV
ncbi:MAG TPA: diacylglycerol kinase family protein, partial [Gemmatimonadaceae bacterium]|nr:diacylglycerol kinase family protein [Gemmatimonadaceae bacterium]